LTQFEKKVIKALKMMENGVPMKDVLDHEDIIHIIEDFVWYSENYEG